MSDNKFNVLSLFAGGGIAETYYNECGINVCVANELLPDRADFYKYCYPETKMICGDISDQEVYTEVIKESRESKVNFIIATPPCQGMSTLGKKEYETDERNLLVWYAINSIRDLDPEYVMIENVPKFTKIMYDYNGVEYNIESLLIELFDDKYNIEVRLLNAKNYGIAQSRPRIIIKMYKKGKIWPWPEENKKILALRDVIYNLPSLESGESSDIKWHNALVHNDMQVEALRHTPEGKSAMKNSEYYPKKKDGTPVKGFHNTYKRMKWDEPSPARATNTHLMSGHNNVHPGRYLGNGLWSDARVLTLRELIIVSSLPIDWNIPKNVNESFLRQIIGEAIPPLLSKKIVETLT